MVDSSTGGNNHASWLVPEKSGKQRVGRPHISSGSNEIPTFILDERHKTRSVLCPIGPVLAMESIQVPTVTMEDLVKFQTDHFQHLEFPFNATENDVYDGYRGGEYTEEEEEDLGYYEDGVKRTLSDEQVKIFRHSEIHSLLRERQRLREEQEEEEEEEEEEYEAMDVLPDNSLVDNDQKLPLTEIDNKRANANDTEPPAKTVEAEAEAKPDPVGEAYSGRKMVSYSDD
ncbi:uncharacterized protein TRUGW13939_01272 [Talaromyces rugulosus]|uniref:Uncharacterized protein n=1 Tax=Talaromyces rugulosus TaxID=121627 RepID=A0A7H8QJS4_TALRU|nr:uncharacterized protein TRUGW13939_01272 [Talaromyces rugulosus]QKX54188.1 hypothetical protein TRUGW13939_01272 [Talaromyces rugulosus]